MIFLEKASLDNTILNINSEFYKTRILGYPENALLIFMRFSVILLIMFLPTAALAKDVIIKCEYREAGYPADKAIPFTRFLIINLDKNSARLERSPQGVVMKWQTQFVENFTSNQITIIYENQLKNGINNFTKVYVNRIDGTSTKEDWSFEGSRKMLDVYYVGNCSRVKRKF